MSTRWRRLLPALWLLAFALAAWGVLRPRPLPPAPAGWERWTEMGALYALLPDGIGVWAGGSGGLWQVEPGALRPVAVPGLAPETIIYAIARDRAGQLWLGHGNGLSVGRGDHWDHFGAAHGLPPGAVLAIALTEAGGWLGGSGGLLRFEGPPPWSEKQRRRLVVDPTIPDAPVTALLRGSDGALWAGTSAAPHGGLYRLADGKTEHWGTAEGLPHPRITSLLQDEQGRIWVGTGFLNRGGLARLAEHDGRWGLQATFDTTVLAGPKVRSLAEDRAGRLWVGSENDGLAVLAGGRRVARLDTDHGLPGMEVTAIAEATDGALWLATLQGLARIGPETVSRMGGTGEAP